jgi:hypothetical protein
MRRHPTRQLELTLVLAVCLVGCADDSGIPDGGGGRSAKRGASELLPVRPTGANRGDRPAFRSEDGGASEMTWRPPGGEETATDREVARLAPSADGWTSEELSNKASTALKEIVKATEVDLLTDLIANGFEASHLAPDASNRVFSHDGLEVGNAELDDKMISFDSAGLLAELTALRSTAGDAAEIRIKTTGIDMVDGSRFETNVLIEVGSKEALHTQVNASWKCEWIIDEGDVRLKRIVLTRYETVGSPGRTLFADATQAVLSKTPHYEALVTRGIDHWAERLTRIDDMHIPGHHGLAVGDVNGDGLDDVYVCDGGGLSNQLYIQKSDGTVRDASRESGADWLEDSRSALLVDLDNDGDQDLVVATVALILFSENDGNGKFTFVGGFPGMGSPFGLSAADIENDGDLDIYVCSYGQGGSASASASAKSISAPLPFHDAQNGGRNILLKNTGGFGFVDATASVGLDADNTRWSFAAAWNDYDLDGDADLYVANDFGRNCLYRNDEGTFRNVAAEAGVEDQAAGMSVAWGDVNRDGRPDLYVGNMFSAAGSRVTYQRKFTDGQADDAAMQRMARGNTLFLQQADGSFSDSSDSYRVTMGRWAWSSALVDLNNDGWEDIVVANGYLTNRKPDDL